MRDAEYRQSPPPWPGNSALGTRVDGFSTATYDRCVHELSLAQSILGEALQQASLHGAERIVSIRLRIGELSAVVPDALTFSFSIVAEGTVAQDAQILIDHVPWCVRCLQCKTEYHVCEGLPSCPTCRTQGGDTVSGRELQIMEMDVE